MNSVEWASAATEDIPHVSADAPGPQSRELHARMERHATKSYGENASLFPVAFASGSGVRLTDVDGNTYLDFTSGAMVTNIGHSHPTVAEAIGRAAADLDNVNDFATEQRVGALEKLASITPAGMTLFGLYSSTVDVHRAAAAVARASTGRASCATDSDTAVVDTTAGAPACLFVRATDHRGVEHDTLAHAARRARDLGALLIVDEAGSSFGRFGSWFALQCDEIRADVVTMGEEIGNGFPVTAMAVREEHAEALQAVATTSPTGGNPLACAALDAVVDVIQREQLVEHAAAVGELARKGVVALCERHPLLREVHGRGASFTIELEPLAYLDTDEATAAIYRAALARGLLTVHGPGFVRLAPPIVITTELFARGLELLDESVSEVEKHLAVA